MKKLFLALLLASACSIAAETGLSLLPHANGQIEVLIEKSTGQHEGLLLFLHGSSSNGVTDISRKWLEHWQTKGYAVAAISLPGYGGSTGTKDFCGPSTMHALHVAVDAIKEELKVDDFGVVGFGQGGVAGILLSSQRTDMCCVVCSNGGYDLFRHRAPDDILMRILKKQEYDLDCDDDEALELRSPILHIATINAPVFLLHRRGNPIVSEEEAVDFYQAMLKAGKECSFTIKNREPGCDKQKLSYEEILIEVEDWIKVQMHAKLPKKNF